jgi:hypothetical protein
MKRFLLTSFILSLLIFPQLVLAQNITIGGLEISIALLTLVIFSLIIVFLAVGIKFPKARGLPIGMILFALFLLLVFLLPQLSGVEFQIPSNWQQFELPGIVVDIFKILGLPGDWLWMPAFIYLVLIPFVTIFILVYAFLKEINLFPATPNISRVLSFLITFLTIPFGLFAKLINVLFAVFVGLYAVILFSAMFILSAFFMAFKRTAVSYGAAVEAKREAQLKKLYDDIAKINERLANPDISAEERLRLTEERKKKARAIQSLGGTVSPEWTQ